MPVAPGTYSYILAPWQWRTPSDDEAHWEAPIGTVGAVDLRPLPAQALRGTAEGFGFFALHVTADLPDRALYLGNDLHGAVAAAYAEIETRLELSPGDLAEPTIIDNSWRIITDLADATGGNRVRPLMPTVDGALALHMAGHSIVKSEVFQWGAHPATPVIRDVLHGNYRKARHNALRGWDLQQRQHHRRVLDMMRDKFGCFGLTDWRELVPADLPVEPPLPHETVITESFDTADSGTLGGDLTWSEVLGTWQITSNRARTSTAEQAYARAEHDLSSADHYVQARLYIISTGNDNTWPGPAARFDSAASTFYAYGQRVSGTTGARRLYKIINGTATVISSASGAVASGALLRLDVNGSSLEGFANGTSMISATDTAIASGLRCGLMTIVVVGGSTHYEFDDFEAGDISSGGSDIVGARFWMPGAQIYQPRGL